MVLAWKKDEKLKFDTAVRSALGSTGNDFLFTFPAERFPIDTTHVAAIRLCGDDDTCVAYVYREPENGDMLVAHGDALDTEYLDFATSFANILSALGPSITAIRQQQELH